MENITAVIIVPKRPNLVPRNAVVVILAVNSHVCLFYRMAYLKSCAVRAIRGMITDEPWHGNGCRFKALCLAPMRPTVVCISCPSYTTQCFDCFHPLPGS